MISERNCAPDAKQGHAGRKRVNLPLLVKRMADRGWSNKELAYEAGIDPKTVDGILAGDAIPRAGTIVKIARTLRIDPASQLWVIDGTESVPQRQESQFEKYVSPLLSLLRDVPDDVRDQLFYEREDVALRDIAQALPRAKELISICYDGNLLVEDLQNCQGIWQVADARLLFRDLDEIDPRVPGTVPRSKKQLARRREEHQHKREDLFQRVKGVVLQKIAVRYLSGVPVIRGLLVDGRMGFLTFYQRRWGLHSDFSVRKIPLLKIKDSSVEGRFLAASFRCWFEYVWAEGSRAKPLAASACRNGSKGMKKSSKRFARVRTK